VAVAKYISLFILAVLLFNPMVLLGDTPLPDSVVVTDQASSGLMLSGKARFFIEADQAYSIDQVHRDWSTIPTQQVRDKSATLGNGDDVYWLRIELNTADISIDEWMLGVSNGNIDRLTAYLIADNDIEAETTTDTNKPFSMRKVLHPDLYLPVNLQPNKQYQLYLRVEHNGFVDTPVLLISRADMLNWQSQLRFERGIYYGAVLMMVLFNFCLWLSTRQIAYLYYIFFIASMGMIVAIVDGVAFQSLWPSLPWLNRYALNVFTNLPAIFAILFTVSFLNLSLKRSRLLYLLLCLLALNIAILFFSVALPVSYAHFIGASVCLITFPVLLFAGAYSWYGGHFYAKYFTFAWLLLCLMISLVSAAAVDIALIEMNDIWSWLRWSSIVEMTLLSFALAARINYIVMAGEAARAESLAKSDFIAHISHELRTPMNGILGMSELLKGQLTDPVQRHYNQVIYQSGQSLLAVINDILDSAKIEANKQAVVYAAFNIRALANQVLFVIEAQALAKGVELQCDADPAIPDFVIGDAQRIRQVISNLLNNAIRFTDSGSITLSLTALEHGVRFNVVDTGMGISQHTQETLFDAFVQGEVGRNTATKGSGLGLYICRRLVHLMGGEIHCSSAEGVGANFWFDLTLRPAMGGGTQGSNHITEPAEGSCALRLLVAEDNKVNQLVISKMLQKNGHQAAVVDNGAKAVAYYRKHYRHIDVVLMDCEMPVLNGYRAVEKIRRFELARQLPRIPIIAFTAHALPEYAQRCLACGMDDVMVKPIDERIMRELLSKAVVHSSKQDIKSAI
jgi:hypothetical protein